MKEQEEELIEELEETLEEDDQDESCGFKCGTTPIDDEPYEMPYGYIDMKEFERRQSEINEKDPEKSKLLDFFYKYILNDRNLQCSYPEEWCKAKGVTPVYNKVFARYDYDLYKLYDYLVSLHIDQWEVIWDAGEMHSFTDLAAAIKKKGVEDYNIGAIYGIPDYTSPLKERGAGCGLIINHYDKLIYFDLGNIR